MYGHERSLVDSYSGRPFVLLGVNNDGKIARVKKAIKENNLNWRSWYDGSGGPIVKDYGIQSFPTIFLVDHTGVIRYKNVRQPALLDEAIGKLIEMAEADGMKGGSEPGAKLREFVDMTGKYKTVAAYLGFVKGKVVLKREDEKEVKIPWKRLSYEDRQFVAVQRLKEAGLKKALKSDEMFGFDKPFEFTDTAGKGSFKGTFIALNDSKAILWKTDGREVAVPWRKLSDSSKDYIKSEIKRLR